MQGGLIVAAGRVRSKKNKSQKKNETIRPTQNTPRNSQQPGDRDHLETARDETRSTRLPTLARSDRFRLVEIGVVQLSQSVKTTNVTHTDRLNK